MIRFFVVLLFGVVSGGCFAVNPNEDNVTCSGRSLDELYGVYVIHEVVKYGGGLTSESSAEERIGKKLLLEPELFEVRDVSIPDPLYEFTCYPSQREGEISANRWSSFYGYGLEREVIEVLHVYEEGDTSGEAFLNLEVLDGELWEMHDGWIYMMKPSRK